MSDDLHKRGGLDARLISLTEDWEVKYWTTALACSVSELKEAVNTVGHSAQQVKKYLHKHGSALF